MSEHPITDYRKVFFEKYRTTHLEQMYGKEDIRNIKINSPVWDWYYGSLLPRDKFLKIADLGCGIGGFVYWLRSLGYANVVGVDISRENCDYAASLGIEGIIHSDLGQFLSGCGGYDVIVMRDVLEHLNKTEILSTLASTHHILNPGGMLLLQIPNAESLFGAKCRYSDFTHEVSFTGSSIKQVLSVTGFSSVSLKETGPVPHGIKSLLRWVAWLCFRGIISGYSLVEGGAASGLYTQTLIACAKK